MTDRLCDTCGEPTDKFTMTIPARSGRGGKRLPRCQPCRIATKACATLHRAPAPYDEADLDRRLEALRREKADALSHEWMSSTSLWLRSINGEIRRLENALVHLRAWHLTQMAETVADDPAFIRKLLEVDE